MRLHPQPHFDFQYDDLTHQFFMHSPFAFNQSSIFFFLKKSLFFSSTLVQPGQRRVCSWMRARRVKVSVLPQIRSVSTHPWGGREREGGRGGGKKPSINKHNIQPTEAVRSDSCSTSSAHDAAYFRFMRFLQRGNNNNSSSNKKN